MGQLRQEMARRAVHPAHTVVLLPYVQLIGIARLAWLRSADAQQSQAGFMPRFETTMNWSRSLAGFVPGPDDVRLDAAHDLVNAASMLERAGLGRLKQVLGGPLMEAAWSLAALAASEPPERRVAWGERMRAAVLEQEASPALALEAQIGQIALAWAAHSTYPGDALFAADPDLLVLIEGFQSDPLHESLLNRAGDRAVQMRLAPASKPGQLALHRAHDPEDEAERAAACVLAHIGQGRSPVALVAQDRVLTRRASAMLAERGVSVRDETGWTLSTTRAAASIVGLLRAMAWDASSDAVLDWAKNAPAFDPDALVQLEIDLRRAGVREWSRWSCDDAATRLIDADRERMQAPRTMAAWLQSLCDALQRAGQWTVLLQDTAGQAVIDALHLHAQAHDDFAQQTQRIGAGAFSTWVGQVLEAGSFVPPHPPLAQVVVLPPSQLLGRPMAAVVFPGCDENHLSASPDPAGIWTPAQRAVLGLASREQASAVAEAVWQNAIGAPFVDILWRASEGGESLMPGVFVQQVRQWEPAMAGDPRPSVAHACGVCVMPRPSAPQLALTHLTASAYEDLRRCPYRFFALRQLGLRESDELDTELAKRDFGNWVHVVLKHFHEALADAPTTEASDRLLLIEQAADTATREMGLAHNEFLPFAASWPRVRTAYLRWLDKHEADGARFEAAELPCTVPLGRWTLVGRIDRIDRLGDGNRLVIDYKTEARARTSDRVRFAQEDSQLVFYAALLQDDALSAMYLNIAESDATRAYAIPDVVAWRDRLVMAILDDMARIERGAQMPALGDGSACEHCAARGLCRKDFWGLPAAAQGGQAHV